MSKSTADFSILHVILLPGCLEFRYLNNVLTCFFQNLAEQKYPQMTCKKSEHMQLDSL